MGLHVDAFHILVAIFLLRFGSLRPSHNPERIEVIWQMWRADQYCTMVVCNAHTALISCAEIHDLKLFPSSKMQIVYQKVNRVLSN